MLRSMYAGISGMKVNQTKLDVTGNNIANVSTTAFKSSRVRFQDMLSQNMTEAVGPGRNQGGVNGRQVGLGVSVAGIDTIVSQGMMQPTSRNLDVAIDGTGYLVVARGGIPENNAGGINVDESKHTMSGGDFQINYTRDGALALDYQGNLLNSDGYRVMGYTVAEKQDKEGMKVGEQSIDYDANGIVNFVDCENKFGLKSSGNLVPLKIPESIHIKATKIANDDNSKLDMEFSGKGDKGKITTNFKIDTDGKKFGGEEDLNIKIKNIKDTTSSNINRIILVNGEQLLDNNGNKILYKSPLGFTDIESHFKGKNGSEKETDLTKKTKLEEEATQQALKMFGKDTVINISDPGAINGEDESFSWSFTLKAEKDKKIRSFAIEKNGLIKGVVDDGTVTGLGQIAMTSFKNPEGLKKEGKNLYSNTANSGEPMLRSGVGEAKNIDNGDGYGDMVQGMLEMSNVDLAEQFTDMIVTTRAFQASGKMISTGDEILQDIINLKR